MWILLLLEMITFTVLHWYNLWNFILLIPGHAPSAIILLIAERCLKLQLEMRESWPHFFLFPLSQYGFQLVVTANINKPQHRAEMSFSCELWSAARVIAERKKQSKVWQPFPYIGSTWAVCPSRLRQGKFIYMNEYHLLFRRCRFMRFDH